MRGRLRLLGRLGALVVVVGSLAAAARADALYSVTNLGAANPSAAFLNGTNQFDPSGNYLNALSPTDRAAFQMGSFDVFAHSDAGYRSSVENPRMSDISGLGESRGLASLFMMSTGNNHGYYIGTGNIPTPVGFQQQVVGYSPAPEVLPETPYSPQLQSSGVVYVAMTSTVVPGHAYQGSVAGLNDQGSMLLNASGNLNGVSTPYIEGNLPGIKYLGESINLGNLGGSVGHASALNNSNQVVGWSQTASGVQHAFLWVNGQMQDLNLMIPPTSGIKLIDAVGIDASGRIAAYGTDASGQMDEFLLTPQVTPAPEPSTILVFGAALAALAVRQYTRRR